MATIISNVDDRALTQLVAVAAVLTAFPLTTLSGTSADRFKTALATRAATPANTQIQDEQGDLLAVTFLTQNPYGVVYTAKGLARLELEAARSQGY
jgi:hypothetical protein